MIPLLTFLLLGAGLEVELSFDPMESVFPESTAVVNGEGTAMAAVFTDPSTGLDILCFTSPRDGSPWVVSGIPLSHRPISGLEWLQEDLLSFRRWSNPHYGIGYVIDTGSLELVSAEPFADRFFLEQQGVTILDE